MWQEDEDFWSDVAMRATRSGERPATVKGIADAAGRRFAAPAERRRGIPARLARRLYGLHFRFFQAHRANGVDLAHVRGLPLLVLPGVFHPEFFFGTDFFLRCLDDLPVGGDTRVLDMGTGSGALGVALARRGARVTAVDVNPEAVRCARANALLHGVASRMQVIEGDLFEPLAGLQFDLIVFNPPFFSRPARGMPDRAWAAGPNAETVCRFWREAPAYLASGGEVLMLGSTEAPFTRALCRLPGYDVRCLARRELVSERLMLFALRRERQCAGRFAGKSSRVSTQL